MSPRLGSRFRCEEVDVIKCRYTLLLHQLLIAPSLIANRPGALREGVSQGAPASGSRVSGGNGSRNRQGRRVMGLAAGSFRLSSPVGPPDVAKSPLALAAC